MSSFLRGAAVALAAVVVSVSAARADVKADLKESAKAFSKALENGDSATAHKYAITDDQTSKMLDAMTRITKAHKELADAAVAKFGDEGKSLTGPGRMTGQNERITKDLEDADVQVNGDTATVTGKSDRAQPVIFKKQDGIWKLDFTQFPHKEQMSASMPMMEKMAGVFSETAADIKADKYKTVQEARQGMYQKMAAVMGAPGARPGAPAPGGN